MDTKKIIIFCLACVLNAEQVEISADSFFADEKSLVSDLKGNVVVKKGNYDKLQSDKVRIYFDKHKKPIKYQASGNARFQAFVNEKRYSGSGDEIFYEPNTQTYTLSGNANIQEVDSDKKVYGDKIVINQKTGTYSVDSKDNKPVKLIFQIEDKK